ncbi:hypothetical protein ACL7TT_07940 [Microbulbifer sp. 2304DJ12-6]|uniref:hypothetical protein n=1 Tax=Microbulbifer sp. 2304DJ12-6 TaxID=3233340 RepID=UPI0039AF9564
MMEKLIISLLAILSVSVINAAALSASEEKTVRQEHPTEHLYKLWIDYKRDEQFFARFYDSLSIKHIIEREKLTLKSDFHLFFKRWPAHQLYFTVWGA